MTFWFIFLLQYSEALKPYKHWPGYERKQVSPPEVKELAAFVRYLIMSARGGAQNSVNTRDSSWEKSNGSKKKVEKKTVHSCSKGNNHLTWETWTVQNKI